MSPSHHIEKLVADGYHVETIRDRWLLIKRVPYLDKDMEIRYGIIVSDIEMSGDNVKENLGNHKIFFVGRQPYRIDGVKIKYHSNQEKELHPGLIINFEFSYKKEGRHYFNYHEKMSHYVHLISKYAIRKDPSVTFNIGSLTVVPDNWPFKYSDCNSVSPEGNNLMKNFLEMKIGIIGLGGTGAYILDFLSKTPVKEIHLYDGDYLHNKNAFRSPGAISIDDLKNVQLKTDYLKKEYSRLHSNIISHTEYIKIENLNKLDNLSFVFISIDRSNIKKLIIEYLESKIIEFIDVGMGIQIVDDAILGSIRTTLSTIEKRNHIHTKKRIKFGENDNNEYSNIPQIAELNGLNAALAIIRWKKLIGFYHDREKEYHSQYILTNNKIINSDNET